MEIVEYFDGNDIQISKKIETIDNKVILENSNKKRSKLNVNRVVFTHSISGKASTDQAIKWLLSEVSKIKETIDIFDLWELAVEEIKEYSIEELSSIIFTDAITIEKSSLFHLIRDENLHFKRKGLNYIPRTKEQIEEILVQRDKESKKQEILDFYNNNLTLAISGQEVKDKKIFNILKDWLKKLENEELTSILTKFANGQDPRIFVYNLLKKNNQISQDADRFATIYGFDIEFEVEEIASASQIEIDMTNRDDFTNVTTFTIDSADTKEIDDAISIERVENGFVLGIHIADVASHIERDSILDNLASKRLSTLYLETGEILMLPKELSHEKLSLNLGQDRPAFSVILQLDNEFEIVESQVKLTKVKVTNKISYKEVDKILRKGGQSFDQLSLIEKITSKWRKKRFDLGAIEINRPEIQLHVNGDDIELEILNRRSKSRSMISELMIMMNSFVANYANNNNIPLLYRVQEAPDPDYKHFLNYDYYDPVLNDKLIRLIRPSFLTSVASTHYGLGVEAYTQITSPLRRYFDLMMQSQISSFIKTGKVIYSEEDLLGFIDYMTDNNKKRNEMYSKSFNYWFQKYLENNSMYEPIEAVIVGENHNSFTCELLKYGKRFPVKSPYQHQIGDLVSLLIDKVDPEKDVLRFSIMSD